MQRQGSKERQWGSPGKDWNGNRDLQWEAGGMQPSGTEATSQLSKVLVC